MVIDGRFLKNLTWLKLAGIPVLSSRLSLNSRPPISALVSFVGDPRDDVVGEVVSAAEEAAAPSVKLNYFYYLFKHQ